MQTAQSVPKSGEGSWLWLAKIVSGVLIFVLIGVHLTVNHFVAEGGLLTYADVVAYLSNPIIPIMEGTFLVFVVSHSLLGLRSILLDLKPGRGLLKVVDWVLSIVGIVSVVYGIWLLQVIVARGSGG